MRRILHIIDSLDYHGTATQLLGLAQEMIKSGFDVHVCGLDRHAPRLPQFEAAQISTKLISRRWNLDPLADWQLVRHVRRLQPDVVHTWNTVPGMFGPIAAGRPLVAGHYRIDPSKQAWEWAIERRFAGKAARYVTNSPSVCGWCNRHGLPAEKFAVMPSGIEPPPAADLSKDSLLRELNLPADAKLIGAVGRLIPQKRVKDLIWAADLLRVLHDNLRLLVIGDGPLRAQLVEYARLASDLDHIRFLGEGNDLWRIMPHLDVLWNGSENMEQSAANLEAMAAGVPVIASDVPTNRELIIDGETGFLIPPGTRAGRAARARLTHQLFTDENLKARIATKAREHVAQHLSAAQMAKKYVQLYESL
ncbi:MAG TPA: glycosyltransferase [Lacipirellulaceae bacterium]|nr:glycosyltransferase [Lacipirellulaceae bacterium]